VKLLSPPLPTLLPARLDHFFPPFCRFLFANNSRSGGKKKTQMPFTCMSVARFVVIIVTVVAHAHSLTYIFYNIYLHLKLPSLSLHRLAAALSLAVHAFCFVRSVFLPFFPLPCFPCVCIPFPLPCLCLFLHHLAPSLSRENSSNSFLFTFSSGKNEFFQQRRILAQSPRLFLSLSLSLLLACLQLGMRSRSLHPLSYKKSGPSLCSCGFGGLELVFALFIYKKSLANNYSATITLSKVARNLFAL